VYKAVRAGVQEVAVKMLFNADGPDSLKQFRDVRTTRLHVKFTRQFAMYEQEQCTTLPQCTNAAAAASGMCMLPHAAITGI